MKSNDTNVPNKLALLLGCLLAIPGAGQAAELSAPAIPPHFLFIVENSSDTQPIEGEVRQVVFNLVANSAHGNIPSGATIELWTFGNEVRIRGFTPQILNSGNQLELAGLMDRYLRNIPDRGEPSLQPVMETLRNAATRTEKLTVFLITEGQTPMVGTPIDDELNEIYRYHYQNQSESRQPFITTFRIRDGGLAAYAVSADVATLSVPPMPDTLPLQDPESMAAASASGNEKPLQVPDKPVTPRKAVEPIVLRGKNVESGGQTTQDPAATEQAPEEQPAPEQPTPQPVTSIVDTQSAEPDPFPAGPVQPQIPDVAQPAEEVARADVPEPNGATTPVGTEPVPAPATDPIPEAVEPTPEIRPPSSTLAETEVEVTEAPAPPEPKAQPVQLAARTAPGPERTQPPARQPDPASAVPPVAAPTNPPPAAPTETTAVANWITIGGLLLAGLIFFVIAAVFGLILWRRSRVAADPSFITRSYTNTRHKE